MTRTLLKTKFKDPIRIRLKKWLKRVEQSRIDYAKKEDAYRKEKRKHSLSKSGIGAQIESMRRTR